MKSRYSRVFASLAIPALVSWLAVVVFGALVSESGHRALADLASAAYRLKSVILVGGAVSVVLTLLCIGVLEVLMKFGVVIAQRKATFEIAGALIGGGISYATAAVFNGPGAAAGHALFFLILGLFCGFTTAAFLWRRPQNA